MPATGNGTDRNLDASHDDNNMRAVAVDADVTGLLMSVLNSSRDGIAVLNSIRDDQGAIVDFEWVMVNTAAEELIGRTAGYLIGRRLVPSLADHADRWLFDRYVDVVETGEKWTAEHRYGRDGLESWLSSTVVKLGDGFRSTFRAITSERDVPTIAGHHALHDPLTGLPNRVLVENRINHAIDRLRRRSQSLAVLMIDLDRFRVVNDSLGHAAGDVLLTQVAQRLRSVARPSDTIARFGGDVFIVVCEDLGNDQHAQHVARRFVDIRAAPYTVENRDVTMTASIGVAVAAAGDATDAESLLRDADTALYRAKAAGGHTVEYVDTVLDAHAKARLDLEVELRHGVDHNELVVFYQPIVSTDSQRIVAVEALVRWQHPQHGLLLPDAFIDIAEQTGLIVALGTHVLHLALQQLAEWRDSIGDAAPDYVSVNIAAAQLGVDGFADTILHAVATAGLNPSQLCLEVTETAFIRDPITAKVALEALSAVGVKIALDDFGTGYSSLTHLRHFPVDIIKIDHSFIDTIEHHPTDGTLVAAIVAFGETLGKTIITEGVETRNQLDLVTNLGTHLIQGNHHSPPLPAADLTTLLDPQPTPVHHHPSSR